MKAFATALLLLALSAQAQSSDLIIDQGVDQHARAWLAHLDQGKAKEAWEGGSAYLREVLPLEDWLKAMQAVTPLGGLKSRTLTSVTFASKMPGSKDGQYALLHYDSVFQHKDRTTETVVLKRDADQVWRSVGYGVK